MKRPWHARAESREPGKRAVAPDQLVIEASQCPPSIEVARGLGTAPSWQEPESELGCRPRQAHGRGRPGHEHFQALVACRRGHSEEHLLPAGDGAVVRHEGNAPGQPRSHQVWPHRAPDAALTEPYSRATMRILLFDWISDGHHPAYARAVAQTLAPVASVTVAGPDDM